MQGHRHAGRETSSGRAAVSSAAPNECAAAHSLPAKGLLVPIAMLRRTRAVQTKDPLLRTADCPGPLANAPDFVVPARAIEFHPLALPPLRRATDSARARPASRERLV